MICLLVKVGYWSLLQSVCSAWDPYLHQVAVLYSILYSTFLWGFPILCFIDQRQQCGWKKRSLWLLKFSIPPSSLELCLGCYSPWLELKMFGEPSLCWTLPIVFPVICLSGSWNGIVGANSSWVSDSCIPVWWESMDCCGPLSFHVSSSVNFLSVLHSISLATCSFVSLLCYLFWFGFMESK